jgi:acyl-CoA synthetase (AMP-forming)/AMP-acid ligase II
VGGTQPGAGLGALLAAGAGSAGTWLEAARGDRQVWRGDLADLASRWADALPCEPRGQEAARAGLVAPDPVDFAVLFVCLVAAGVTVVPLDPAAPPPSQRELLDRAGAGVVLAGPGAVPLPDAPADDATDAALGRPVVRVGPGLAPPRAGGGSARAGSNGALPPRGQPGAGGVLLFSSGSTGPRKAVLLRERRLLHVARQVARVHRLGPGDRGYNPLPLFHVNAEVVAVLGSLVSGGALVLDGRFHRTGFADIVRDRRITWVNAVPAILSILAAEPGDDPLPAAVRFVRSASAPLPVPVLERFEERWGVPVVETYGMTEAASQITANPLDARRPGSVGLPAGVDLRVDAAGQVWIRGPGVITGYADGAGADRFDAEGWLGTGDVGRLDDDGYLYLSGRGGDAINRGGEKIFPREIEEVLRRHPGVRDAVVVPRADLVLGEVPVAVVVPAAPDGDALLPDLHRLCERRLARSHRPAEVRVLARLPLGATGKVSRPAVRELVAQPLEQPIGEAAR